MSTPVVEGSLGSGVPAEDPVECQRLGDSRHSVADTNVLPDPKFGSSTRLAGQCGREHRLLGLLSDRNFLGSRVLGSRVLIGLGATPSRGAGNATLRHTDQPAIVAAVDDLACLQDPEPKPAPRLYFHLVELCCYIEDIVNVYGVIPTPASSGIDPLHARQFRSNDRRVDRIQK
jgi:hypothetical protein